MLIRRQCFVEILVMNLAKSSRITASSQYASYTTDKLVDGVGLINGPNLMGMFKTYCFHTKDPKVSPPPMKTIPLE